MPHGRAQNARVIRHVFAEPMFNQTVEVFGISIDLILFVVAAACWVVGMVLLRRVLHIEGDAHSFRATNRRDLTTTVTIVGVVAFVALGTLVLAISAT